jgi:CBS-domain-containing membrane protein
MNTAPDATAVGVPAQLPRAAAPTADHDPLCHPDAYTAADAAATEIVTVEPSTPLSDAARLMLEHRSAHLVVISDGHPAGVVSSLDIAGALAWGRA